MIIMLGLMALVVIAGVAYFVGRDIRKRFLASHGRQVASSSGHWASGLNQPTVWGVQSPGWYEDPEHRFARRYFDGVAWTGRVSSGLGMPEQADAEFSEGMNR